MSETAEESRLVICVGPMVAQIRVSGSLDPKGSVLPLNSLSRVVGDYV